MANVRILGTSHMDGITLTATSEALSVDNLQNPSVKKVWRSTDTASQTISGPFGEMVNVNAVYLKNTNVTGTRPFTIVLSDDGFTTIKYAYRFGPYPKVLSYREAMAYLPASSGGERLVDANGDAVLDGNGDAVLEASYSVSLPVTATHMRLLVDDADNSDGYLEMGRVKLGEYFDAPNSNNVAVGPELSYVERGELVQTRGGGFRAEQETPQRRIRVTYETVADSDAWTINGESFAEIMEHVGQRDDIVIDVYPAEGTDRERRHVLSGRKTNNSAISGNFNALVDGTLTLHSRVAFEVTEAL